MNCSNTNSNSKPNATSYTSNSRKKHRTSQPGYTATNKQRLFVEHNYVDRSNVSRSECTDPDQFERVLQRAKDRNNLRSLPFLAKLHYILEKYEHSGLIQWAPHGRAFAVLDVKRFVSYRIYLCIVRKCIEGVNCIAMNVHCMRVFI